MISLLLVHISWGIVLAAAFVDFFLSMLWYSPLVWRDRWARLVGVQLDASTNLAPLVLGAFGVSLAHAYGLAWLLERMNALHLVDAVVVVLMVSVLFIGSHMVSGILWERRPGELALINLGATLLCSLAMALLFVYTAV